MEYCVKNIEGKDSNFPCFFCQRCVIETNSRASIKLSLSKILNYLQLFPYDGKRKRLCYPSDEKLQNLSICEHCSQMMGEFGELYHLLEVTELRLNRCLERIQEVMSKIELRSPKPDGKEEDQDLRTVMIERIKEISTLSLVALRSRSQIVPTSVSVIMNEFSNGLPEATKATELVPLQDVDEKLDENKPALPPLESHSETGTACQQVRKRNKKRKKKKTETRTKADSPRQPRLASNKKAKSETDKNLCKFCNISFQKSSNFQRHVKYSCPEGERLPPPDTEKLLTCAYCTYECANHRGSMNRHLVRLHPEMFFQSERNNLSISSSSPWKYDHFKRILTEIAFPKFLLKNGSSSSCSCSVCGKKYRSTKGFTDSRSMMKVHLVNHHIQDVREYLRDILGRSDKSLRKKLGKTLSSTKEIDGRGEQRSFSQEDEDTLMNVDESCISNNDEDDVDNDLMTIIINN